MSRVLQVEQIAFRQMPHEAEVGHTDEMNTGTNHGDTEKIARGTLKSIIHLSSLDESFFRK